MRALLWVGLFSAVAWGAETSSRCTYEVSVWNTKLRRTSERTKVSKSRGELTLKEKGPLNCTPCEQDQEWVTLSNGVKFRACFAVAKKFAALLENALKQGYKIETIVGYRAQISRGPADEKGNRTELSNHSFGVALDVNEEHNGLYERCTAWSEKCRLRKAGPYRPGVDPLSLTAESLLVKEMKESGYSWGGEIVGQQKDFMHFSPSGY